MIAAVISCAAAVGCVVLSWFTHRARREAQRAWAEARQARSEALATLRAARELLGAGEE